MKPCVLDPFAGSATTLVAAENAGVEAWGMDAHPFVSRVARAKLQWRTDPEAYRVKIKRIARLAGSLRGAPDEYLSLIRRCYDDGTLAALDAFRRAYEEEKDDSPASELAWLTLIGILRRCSKVGTAQWQYVLPNKPKQRPARPDFAFEEMWRMIYQDMCLGGKLHGPRAIFLQSDARTCSGVPRDFFDLVISSPPYPNNYDYADATRLEMSFMREIGGWGDLQDVVRKYLIRSCSQHVPERSVDFEAVLGDPILSPICAELSAVCRELAAVRKTKGGRKTYHLMIACYFSDLAQVWRSLRLVCRSPSVICFVIGDSAPYGVYVPVIPWLGKLALNAGFKTFTFEKTRDRNVKWKNRKHRVPLQEGLLWIQG